KNLRAPDRVAELDLPAAERGRRGGRLAALWKRPEAEIRYDESVEANGEWRIANSSSLFATPHSLFAQPGTTAMNIMQVDYSTKIPNNVNLSEDRQVLKALEGWHPGYVDWWQDMGPEGFQQSLVYLRTAYSVDPRGWAKFDYVKMPDYRWGI